MFYHHITTTDVNYHQERVRAEFIASQRTVSIRGFREIIGNTFIQIGSSIHGKAMDACQDAARTHELLSETQREWRRPKTTLSTPIGS